MFMNGINSEMRYDGQYESKTEIGYDLLHCMDEEDRSNENFCEEIQYCSIEYCVQD